MFDIPLIQLVAITFLGFLIGFVFRPLLIKNPLLFTMWAGIAFYLIRYVVSVYEDGPNPGNGIISAALMWIVYASMMLLGKWIAEHKWGSEQ